MDRLDAMSVLLAVVEAGSLSAASRRLGMPLTTVSRKISELESHLKTKLLHRSTRQMTLTDTGRSYLDACRRIIEQVEEAEREAKGEYRAPRGDLTVTAPTVLGHLHLLPVILEFLVAYPDIDLRLLLSDNILNLLEDRVDLAIRIGTLPDSSMIATRIGTIRRVVCASPTYLAVRGRPQKPSDLRDHDCITFDRVRVATCLEVCDRRWRNSFARPIKADCEHRRSCYRRGRRRRRHHPGNVLQDGECEPCGCARNRVGGVRTHTPACEYCLPGAKAPAPQSSRFPGLGDTTPQSSADSAAGSA